MAQNEADVQSHVVDSEIVVRERLKTDHLEIDMTLTRDAIGEPVREPLAMRIDFYDRDIAVSESELVGIIARLLKRDTKAEYLIEDKRWVFKDNAGRKSIQIAFSDD